MDVEPLFLDTFHIFQTLKAQNSGEISKISSDNGSCVQLMSTEDKFCSGISGNERKENQHSWKTKLG